MIGTGSNRIGDPPHVDHLRAVKKYKRSAADQKINPETIRPPSVLKKTMEFLWREIADNPTQPFHVIASFVSDRARAVRKDFTSQRQNDEVCITAHEQMARFHILAGHRLCNADKDVFDKVQNSEKITQCLRSLFSFYNDNYANGIIMPNWDEFAGYDMLIDISTVPRKIEEMHSFLLNTPCVQFALKVYLSNREGNYYQFFKLLRSASYLQACLMHLQFISVQEKALQTMDRAFSPYPLSSFANLLCFNSIDHAQRFCEHYQIGLALNDSNNEVMLQFSKRQSRPEFSAINGRFSPRPSNIIEDKARNKPVRALVYERDLSLTHGKHPAASRSIRPPPWLQQEGKKGIIADVADGMTSSETKMTQLHAATHEARPSEEFVSTSLPPTSAQLTPASKRGALDVSKRTPTMSEQLLRQPKHKLIIRTSEEPDDQRKRTVSDYQQKATVDMERKFQQTNFPFDTLDVELTSGLRSPNLKQTIQAHDSLFNFPAPSSAEQNQSNSFHLPNIPLSLPTWKHVELVPENIVHAERHFIKTIFRAWKLQTQRHAVHIRQSVQNVERKRKSIAFYAWMNFAIIEKKRKRVRDLRTQFLLGPSFRHWVRLFETSQARKSFMSIFSLKQQMNGPRDLFASPSKKMQNIGLVPYSAITSEKKNGSMDIFSTLNKNRKDKFMALDNDESVLLPWKPIKVANVNTLLSVSEFEAYDPPIDISWIINKLSLSKNVVVDTDMIPADFFVQAVLFIVSRKRNDTSRKAKPQEIYGKLESGEKSDEIDNNNEQISDDADSDDLDQICEQEDGEDVQMEPETMYSEDPESEKQEAHSDDNGHAENNSDGKEKSFYERESYHNSPHTKSINDEDVDDNCKRLEWILDKYVKIPGYDDDSVFPIIILYPISTVTEILDKLMRIIKSKLPFSKAVARPLLCSDSAIVAWFNWLYARAPKPMPSYTLSLPQILLERMEIFYRDALECVESQVKEQHFQKIIHCLRNYPQQLILDVYQAVEIYNSEYIGVIREVLTDSAIVRNSNGQLIEREKETIEFVLQQLSIPLTPREVIPEKQEKSVLDMTAYLRSSTNLLEYMMTTAQQWQLWNEIDDTLCQSVVNGLSIFADDIVRLYNSVCNDKTVSSTTVYKVAVKVRNLWLRVLDILLFEKLTNLEMHLMARKRELIHCLEDYSGINEMCDELCAMQLPPLVIESLPLERRKDNEIATSAIDGHSVPILNESEINNFAVPMPTTIPSTPTSEKYGRKRSIDSLLSPTTTATNIPFEEVQIPTKRRMLQIELLSPALQKYVTANMNESTFTSLDINSSLQKSSENATTVTTNYLQRSRDLCNNMHKYLMSNKPFPM